MVKAGWLGKKSGRGFYIYSPGAKSPAVNDAVNSFRANDSAAALSRRELQERMVLLMINEAARCLAEGVVATPEDVDFGMVMGTGFAPFRGGPLRYADSVGIARVVSAMRCWASTGAICPEPCALLQTMANRREKFYNQKG